MQISELTPVLNALAEKIIKVSAEMDALLAVIDESPDVPQEVLDAVESLQTAVTALDDKNPDAETPE
jgi:hypothetical protein